MSSATTEAVLGLVPVVIATGLVVKVAEKTMDKKSKSKGYPSCVGNKIRSEGMGRGLSFGNGSGPIGMPFGKKTRFM